MAQKQTTSTERQAHWDDVYRGSKPAERSWFQSQFLTSFDLFDVLEVQVSSAIVDIGGGESRFVDELIARGFSDLSVLDISKASLETSRARIGPDHAVSWIAQDLLNWQPERRYDVWHDRAVFHFLAGDEVRQYRELLLRALAPNGLLILGTFALDGPEYCSGLSVSRYGREELSLFLGDDFEVIDHVRELHTTPGQVVQPFTWIGAKRRTDPTSRVTKDLGR